MMNWSHRFQDPITMPDGSTIRTIGEAAKCDQSSGQNRQHRTMATRREGVARGRGAWRPVRVHGADQLLYGDMRTSLRQQQPRAYQSGGNRHSRVKFHHACAFK
jgi:hypothetical protein